MAGRTTARDDPARNPTTNDMVRRKSEKMEEEDDWNFKSLVLQLVKRHKIRPTSLRVLYHRLYPNILYILSRKLVGGIDLV